MRQLLLRLSFVLRHRQLEADLSEELAFHEEMKRRELEERGIDANAAHFAARRAMGNITLAKEHAREESVWPLLEAFIRDLRFGGRRLWKDAGFSALAVLILAIGIGANTAVLTLVDSVLIRPLPYPDADRLATFGSHVERGATSDDGYGHNGATWLAIRDNLPAFDVAVASGSIEGVNLTAGERASYVTQQRVSAGFLRVLGVSPALGREFTVDEDRVGGPAVVILSHRLWIRAFDGRSDVIGRAVTLRGEPFTVVGVMPADFRFGTPTDVWTPLRPSTRGEGAGQNYLLAARLKPGVTWAAASAQAETIGSSLLRDVLRPPSGVRITMRLVPLQRVTTGDLRQPLLVLWAAAGLVLLIGCVNIAGLMLARGSARAPELATRVALGGGRVALARQMFAESLALAACGGVAGVALGYLLTGIASTRLQTVIWLPATPDARVLTVIAGVTLLTSVCVGLLPAAQASRTDVRAMLVETGSATIAGRRRRWPARLLVTIEVALGIVLVVSAGLLLRSFSYLTRLPPGFDGTHVITATLSMQDERYRNPERVIDLFTRSLERLRLTPGIEQAAIALTLPYERALNEGWRFEGAPDSQPVISLTYVTPDYFAAFRIPLRRGRLFGDRDRTSAPAVVIVNDAFVRRYSRDVDPVGRRLRIGGNRVVEIVGVVGDIQQRVTFGSYGPVTVLPAAYVPATQFGDEFALAHTWFEPSWIVRTTGPLPSIAAIMQDAVARIDPQLPFNRFRTPDDLRDEAVIVARVQAALLGALAGIALLLCALGVYGLMAHAITERRREFGVRLALGASSAQLLRAATAPALGLGLAGVGVGLAVSAAASRVMEGLIFGVSAHDAATFGLATVVVLTTIAVAALLPALRILRVNVLAALNAR